jgi:hypothetical protein
VQGGPVDAPDDVYATARMRNVDALSKQFGQDKVGFSGMNTTADVDAAP